MAFQVIGIGEEMSILWVIHRQKNGPAAGRGVFFEKSGPA